MSFISYKGYVRIVQGLCTNGTWAMYEWYMGYVRTIHGLCTNDTWAMYE